MKSPDLKKITKAMEKSLDSKRYEHTKGVEYTAAALAMCHGENIDNARLAGLLHDCAKCISDEKRLSFCEKYNISINEVERKNPSLLHAKVGSFIAMEEFHVKDKDVINAILNHTTGRPGMSLLEKIIFVADYIEPGRKQAPRLDEIRTLVFRDLEQGMLMILEDTLAYLQDSKESIDPMTQKTYEYYRNIIQKNNREEKFETKFQTTY